MNFKFCPQCGEHYGAKSRICIFKKNGKEVKDKSCRVELKSGVELIYAALSEACPTGTGVNEAHALAGGACVRN